MNQKKGNGILKTFSVLTLVIIIAKIAGFIKQMVVAGTFGATIETDLIQMSQGLISNSNYVIVRNLNMERQRWNELLEEEKVLEIY